MKQNITQKQINTVLISMLNAEYCYNDKLKLVVVKILSNINWLNYSLKLRKTILRSNLMCYLNDDDIQIIIESYTAKLSIYNKLINFELDLLDIVQHLVWVILEGLYQ